MEIYINRDGQQFGPYTVADVNTYLASGELSGDDMAWYDGAEDWMPIRSMEGVRAPANYPREKEQKQSTRNADVVAQVLAIGKYQKYIVGMLVFSFLFLPIALLILPFFLYGLAKATKSAKACAYSAFPIISVIIFLGLLGLPFNGKGEGWIPLLLLTFYLGNLGNLIFLNHRANKVLKGFGVQVGIMGAQPEDINNFVTGKIGKRKRHVSFLFIVIVTILLFGLGSLLFALLS